VKRPRVILLFIVPFALAAAVPGGPAPAAAQTVGAEWHEGWSPLSPLLDVSRPFMAIPRTPSLLTAPRPRVGMHWTAGNPAAMAWETADDRQEFRLGTSEESGAYRRVADPGSRASTHSFAGGWQRLPSGTVLAGGILAGRELLGGGTDANTTRAHTASPHLLVDASGTSLRQVIARMDGAAGWEGGGWGLGVAGGYEAVDTRSEGGGVFRGFRYSVPAAALGVARQLGPVRIGVHGKWQGGYEFVSLSPREEVLLVYRLAGYTEPRAIEHTRCCETRTTSLRTHVGGISAAGRLAGVELVAFGEVAELQERQAAVFENDPPTNDWLASGGTVGGAGSFAVAGGRLDVTLDGRFRWLSGESRQHEFAAEGVIFTADESLLRFRGEGRYALSERWSAGLSGFLDRNTARREERSNRLVSDVSGWMYGGAAEAAGRITGPWRVSGGGGISRYVAAGQVPNPAARNEAFRQYVARDYLMEVSPAMAWSVAGSVARRPPAGRSIWLRGSYGSAKPQVTGAVTAETPQGSRAMWSVALGVALGG
jgi:hypothetical protein